MSSIKLKFGGVCRRLFLETPDFGALVQHINTCVFSHAPPSFRLTYNGEFSSVSGASDNSTLHCLTSYRWRFQMEKMTSQSPT